MTDEENKTSFAVILARTFTILLFIFILALVSGTFKTCSKNKIEEKESTQKADSLKLKLINPDTLLVRAKAFFNSGKLKTAETTLKQIIFYYPDKKDSVTVINALKLLTRVQRAIKAQELQKSPGKEISTQSTLGNLYTVIVEAAFAATSEANYKIMWNCITNGDKEAIQNMVLNGQVVYLYKGDQVYIVKPGIMSCTVRKKGSTIVLYTQPVI